MIDTSVTEIPVIDRRLERRFNFVQGVLIALLIVVIFVPIIASWWIGRQLPVVSTVSIDNVRLLSPSELCPGDALTFSYDFHAKGAGILVRDLTLWRTDPPPRTLIYSTARRFILDGPIDQHLTETWHIPSTYLDYETEQMTPLPPGGYRRYLAISSPSRSTVVAITSVAFTIKPDCP